MKTCFKCNREQPLENFYPHPKMADGRLGKCKDCTRAEVNKRRKDKMQDPVWKESELERQRAKSQRARAEGTVKPVDPEARKATLKRHKAKHPERHEARRMVSHAIRAGLLVRQPCFCGKEAEAHHDDYSEPLVVMWLCPEHHAARHVELRKQQRQQS